MKNYKLEFPKYEKLMCLIELEFFNNLCCNINLALIFYGILLEIK